MKGMESWLENAEKEKGSGWKRSGGEWRRNNRDLSSNPNRTTE